MAESRKRKRRRPTSGEVRIAPIDEVRANKLYIGNLDVRVTQYIILKLFKPFGRIVREEFMWHNSGARRGEPKGFCFVEYSTREEAERAKEAMNKKRISGREISVRFVAEKVVKKSGGVAGLCTGTGTTATTGGLSQGEESVTESVESIDYKMEAIRLKLQALQEEGKTDVTEE